MMFFKIDLLDMDTMMDFVERVEGRNLVTLANELRRWDRVHEDLTIRMRIKAGTHDDHDDQQQDWTCAEAQEFLQALTAVNCNELEILNFLNTPLPLLETCLSKCDHAGRSGQSEDDIMMEEDEYPCQIILNGLVPDHDGEDGNNEEQDNSTQPMMIDTTSAPAPPESSTTTTTTGIQSKLGPFSGLLAIMVHPSRFDWEALVSWWGKTSLAHQDSCLHYLCLHLEGSFMSNETQVRQCQRFLKNVLDGSLIQTTEFEVYAEEVRLPSRSFLACFHKCLLQSTPVKVVQFNVDDIEFSYSKERLECLVKDPSRLDWMMLSEILKDLCSNQETVEISMEESDCALFGDEDDENDRIIDKRMFDDDSNEKMIRQRQGCQQCLHTIASLPNMRHLCIKARTVPAMMLSDAITHLLSTTKALDHLEIKTYNDDWMTDKVIKAFQTNESIKRLEVKVADVQPTLIANLETILIVNVSLTFLRVWKFAPDSMHTLDLTPILHMHMGFNRSNQSNTLKRCADDNITRDQWITLLESCNHLTFQGAFQKIVDEDTGVQRFQAMDRDALQLSCIMFSLKRQVNYWIPFLAA